ncbi:MAG: hypothetical protein FD139_2897 [Methylocystaceae bacterium]|nr:MAG: hypothetical protein FD148_1148 [Methylocystaceae bacterium]KAF0211420.1 MAG: hypothetical protein FD172_1905 [Methylocystaceae bacterium]TXT43559.1 MAG: hypothetical protein FD139_2897 [Methylocystaceae bacterium]
MISDKDFALPVFLSPFHGENRGSNPLGRANKINKKYAYPEPMRGSCPTFAR